MKKDDHDLIKLFRSDPDFAMSELIEQYTGLVWSIASKHLNHVEDIRECVNDTFSEFYRRWEIFDSSKGTLASYLVAIAQNLAITKYQKNKVYNLHEPLNEAVHGDFADAIDQVEWKMVLESAMDVLSTDEQKIIQMKYYENMTVKEIADALNIPYETVKKRHQRSLGKLKKALIGLLIFVLISVLAACAYIVLHYFGVVPGYGINVSEAAAVYVLEEPVSGETTGHVYTIQDAYLMNGQMRIRMTEPKDDSDIECVAYQQQLIIDGVPYQVRMQSFYPSAPGEETILFDYYDMPEIEKGRVRIEVEFYYNEVSLSFALVEMTDESTESFSTAMVNNRGLLAIPIRTNGRLMVEIPPLNDGPATILPSLIRCVYEELDAELEPVTLTAEDGNVREGRALGYSPGNTTMYYRWDFGAGEPGTYTLRVPYLYETLELPEDLEIPMDMKNGLDTKTVYDIPGGSLRLVSCEPISPDAIPSHPALQILPLPDTDYWVATLEYTSDRENIKPLGFDFNVKVEFTNSDEPDSDGLGTVLADGPNQIAYLIDRPQDGLEVSKFTLIPGQSWGGIEKDSFLYRKWKQEFVMTVTFEE